MEQPDIFIDWTYFELVPSRRKRGPRFLWSGFAPEDFMEVIVACKDDTIEYGDFFDPDDMEFRFVGSDPPKFWAYPVWRECKPGEKPVLPLIWHPLRLVSSSPIRWEGKLPDPEDENVLVALDTGRVIAGDGIVPETGAFEISPAEHVRYWASGNWMDVLKDRIP